jgi:hypothetical protein
MSINFLHNIFLIWKNFFLKISNISENNIISVELAKGTKVLVHFVI